MHCYVLIHYPHSQAFVVCYMVESRSRVAAQAVECRAAVEELCLTLALL